MFTYQDEDSDIDVAIQFFDKEDFFLRNSQVENDTNHPEPYLSENHKR